MYGQDSVAQAMDFYQSILRKKEEDGLPYVDFGFDCLSEVKMKPGDLVLIGAFTFQTRNEWKTYD